MTDEALEVDRKIGPERRGGRGDDALKLCHYGFPSCWWWTGEAHLRACGRAGKGQERRPSRAAAHAVSRNPTMPATTSPMEAKHGRRLAEEVDADGRRPDHADAGPDRIGHAERQAAQRDPEEADAPRICQMIKAPRFKNYIIMLHKRADSESFRIHRECSA